MKNLVSLTVLVSALSLLLTAPGIGSPQAGPETIPLHLIAPSPRFEALPDDPRLLASMTGFGRSDLVGQPALPVKVVLVAIPEGGAPQLQILQAPFETLTGLELAPAPGIRVAERLEQARGARRLDNGGRDRSSLRSADVQEYERDFAPAPAIDMTEPFHPPAPVRLGSIGYMRQQRFVEVIYAPLLYSPGRREGHLYRDIAAQVIFEIPAVEQAGGAFRPDPFFEETYRSSLINYEQGKSFRSAETGRRVPAFEGTIETTGIAPEALPGSPRYKIEVSQTGVHRLDHAYLSANAPALIALDPGTWFLQAEGVEVPIAIRDLLSGGSAEADGVFGPTDALEFYGRSKVDEPPTVLNHDFPATVIDIYQANDFTDLQVYWLSSADPADSHLRIPSVSGAPGSPAFALATDFEETARWEENEVFIPLGDAEPFFSLPSLLANSVADQRDIGLALPGIAPVTASGTLTVQLRGGSSKSADPDHRTQVWINADTPGGIDVTWDGEIIQELSLPVDQTILTDPSTLHILADVLSGVTTDRQYLDTITLTYRRLFQASGEVLTFSYPNQDARFTVGGLSAMAPVIYEIGRPLSGSVEVDPIRITGALPSGAPTDTYTFEVPQDTGPGAPAMRTYIVAGPSALQIPDAMVLADDPVLQVTGIAADILVIGTRDLIDVSPGQESLAALLAHRLATQGLTSRVVFIDQIYDEFSDGRRDVNAVRAFLDFAFDNWTGPGGTDAPPSFVFLIGDGSPDYKNTLNRSDWVDQVPTPIMYQRNSVLGYYSSDNYLAAFRGGDQIPDVHLGRLSTRTAAAAAAALDKIRLYESSPPAGLWKGRAALTAGDGKFGGEADGFQAINDAAASSYFSAAPYSHPVPPLYFAEPPWNGIDAAGFNGALIGEIENGAGVVTYIGHGNFDTWGLATLMTTEDAEALTNGLQLPFMLNVNCLAGGFHFLLGSGALGEGLVNNPAGGAIAILAPSGLSSTFVGAVISEELFAALFGPAQERILGPAAAGMRMALWSRGSITDLQSYTFLGDPATVLAIPAPPPPTGLAPTAGNGEVTLSWTAPPQAVAGIRVYRAAISPAAPYAAVPCTPLTATSCVDETVSNATRYYYYVVSLDNDGFEGPASNFNSDCDGGPDCVTALPLNPGPPDPPTALTATDIGSGGTLFLSWSANPENDIDTYTVYYGTASESYTNAASAGGPSRTLFGLTDNVRYYIVVTATNTSGHESKASIEVSAVPHLIQGIAPPRAISDLHVSMPGADIMLAWSQPTEDIYGRPATAAGYRIYRGDTPGFQISPQTLIGTISGGATTSFADIGAALDPGSAYYLVIALDSAGYASGAGGELPAGIGDLQVSVLTGDTVRLAWSAVINDVGGVPTLVDHYQIHVNSVPAGRGSLGPTSLLMDTAALSADLVLPAAPHYISVLAVDNRGNLSPY